MKTPKYYHIDCGFYPVQIKLCFNNKDYQSILADYKVDLKATALDIGIAETHLIPVGTNSGGIIVMVFDLKECGEDPIEMAGYVAHEVVHCIGHIFELIGEDVENIGRETNAYLMQHLVKQVTKGILLEKLKNAGKGNRKVSKQKGKGDGRSDVQVDQCDHRRTGPHYNPEQQDPPSRTEDSYGGALGTTKVGFLGSRGAWADSEHYPE